MRDRARRPQPADIQEQARQLLITVDNIVRQILQYEGFLPDQFLEDLVLTIPLQVRPSYSREASDASRLLADIRKRIRDLIRGRGTFRFGRVYCFQCQKPDCEHSAPKDPMDIFCGYSTSGRPIFQSFVNFLLERGDPRVPLLYSNPGFIVALPLAEDDLSHELLSTFSSDLFSYRVRGEVIVGLLPETLFPAAKAALTAQVVELNYGAGQKRRLRLNLLGASLDDLLQATAEPSGFVARSLMHTVRATQSRLDALGRKAWHYERRGLPDGIAEALPPLLNRLRLDLEHIFRTASRRTRHAEERRESAGRPIGQALRDAMEASADRVLMDTRRGTIVVLGPRGRTHVFSPDGRLVTTLVLTPQEVQRRYALSRWRTLAPEEVLQWRKTLQQK